MGWIFKKIFIWIHLVFVSIIDKFSSCDNFNTKIKWNIDLPRNNTDNHLKNNSFNLPFFYT
jgi:hypothetical protein